MSIDSTTSERIKDLKRQYYRDWYARNRDRVKASQDRYWQKKLHESERKENDQHEADQP